MHQILSQPKNRRSAARALDAIETALLCAYRTHDWNRSTRSAIDLELFDNKPKRRASFTRRHRAQGV